jgi:HlyD family secretion protein
MTASTTVFTEEVNNALILPNKAIQFRPDSLVSRRYLILGGDGKKGAMAKIERAGRTSRVRTTGRITVEMTMIRSVAQRFDKKDSTLSRRSITIGLDDQTQVQVLSGLTKDDEVVTGYQLIDKKGRKQLQKALSSLPGRSVTGEQAQEVQEEPLRGDKSANGK